MRTHENFAEELLRSTVSLARIDDARPMPGAFGSGMLLDYADRRILLTVGHVTGDQGRWAIQMRYEKDKGTQLYGIGSMNLLAKMSLSDVDADLENIDFAYAEVPNTLQPWRQEIDPVGNLIKREVPIVAISSDLTVKPKAHESYGFCGGVKYTWEEHFGQKYLGADEQAAH
jgi:hypothetical protein